MAAMVIGARAGPTETAMTVTVSLAPRMPPEWLRLGSVNPCVLRASLATQPGAQLPGLPHRTGQGTRCMKPCGTSHARAEHKLQ